MVALFQSLVTLVVPQTKAGCQAQPHCCWHCGTLAALVVGAPEMEKTVPGAARHTLVFAWQGLVMREAILEILGDALVTFCHLKTQSLASLD